MESRNKTGFWKPAPSMYQDDLGVALSAKQAAGTALGGKQSRRVLNVWSGPWRYSIVRGLSPYAAPTPAERVSGVHEFYG